MTIMEWIANEPGATANACFAAILFWVLLWLIYVVTK
jgi:hypothetical protein